MLQLMRKHARNWLIKILLGIIIIVFIFYFGSIRGKKQAESIAIIDGKCISYTNFRNEYQNLINLYRQRFGNNLTDDILKELNLKQRALDNLINQVIANRKADELKLYVSENEIKAFILSYPAFQRNGVFDNQVYHQTLRYYRMSPEDFEASQKRVLKIAKLEELIMESVKVSEIEIYNIYRIQNERINLEFIKIATEGFKSKVKLTDADLKKHFEEHREYFRIPEKVQVEYIPFFGKDFAKSVKVPEDDVADYYDHHKSKFTKPGGKTPPLSEVKNRIIAEIKLTKGMYAASEEAQKAHDTIYQEENFEDYAAINKLRTNITGFFSRDNPPGELIHIKDIAKHAFKLQKGDISPVLSSPKGSYIIRLVSRKPSYIPAFRKAKKVIEKDYIEKESRNLCRKEVEGFLHRLKNGEDTGNLSQKVSETGLFAPNPNIPKIGFSREIKKALFKISEKTPYPDKAFYVDGNLVIIRFKERGKLDNKDFEAKKVALKSILLKIKANEYFQSWIEETKTSMIKEGKLKITKDLANF